MAVKDKAALDAAIVTATANIATLIEDNNNGDITEQDVRDAYGNVLSVAQDVVDSSFNVVDDASITKILHGSVDLNGSPSPGFVFNGFSVSVFANQFTITHNIGHTNYSVNCSININTTNSNIAVESISNNSFVIRTAEGGFTNPIPFCFQMIINI